MQPCRAATTMWRYAAVPRRERTTIRTMAMGKRTRDRLGRPYDVPQEMSDLDVHQLIRRLQDAQDRRA